MHMLIVDDEANIRKSLNELIPWSELGIDSTDTAKNGVEGLEKAIKQAPDILLTDVRMPKMDGLKFAEQIRTMFPECKIIFLSGFADKEYLMKAIHLNAVNYVEKPVDIMEIREVVKRAVDMHREKKSRLFESHKLKSCIQDNLPCIRQDIALHLLQPDYPAEYAEQKLSDYAINIFNGQWCNVIYVIINWKAESGDSVRNSIKEKLLNRLNEAEYIDEVLAAFDNNNNLVMISGRKIISSCDNKLVQRIKDLLISICGDVCTFSIGIGCPVRKLCNINSSLAGAKKAALMQFYYGTNQVLSAHSMSCRNYRHDKNLYKNFKTALRENNISQACKIIENLTREIMQIKETNINYIKNIYFNLLLLFFETARDIGLIDNIGSDEKNYVWLEIDRIATIMGLSRYIESNIREIYHANQDQNLINPRIREIINYINDNYGNNRLSLQSISESIYLSQTYLCAFFKKATGKTLNQYITEVRIEKAKEMLRDTGIKVYEIAYRVGFTDTNYFSTLFKKHVGITPSEYKERGIEPCG